LDVGSNIDSAKTNNSNTSNKLSDPFDFLGSVKTESSAPTTILDSFTPSINNSKNQDILSFDLNFANNQPAPVQNISLNQGGFLNQQIRAASIPPALNFNAKSNLPTNGLNFTPNISLPKGISLNLNPEVDIY
jgi:hypothetical protein